MIRVASLFCGMGGFALATRPVGMKTVWANDSDPRALSSFKANFPDTKIIGENGVASVRPADGDVPQVDILTAGFPCQSFSQAGDRKGFDDERGRLFFDIIRIVEEFGDARPHILVLENVPHLLHGDGGGWMARIEAAIRKAGYWFSRRSSSVLNTSEVSATPQNRERLYMVALSTAKFPANRFRFPEKNGPPDSLAEYLDTSAKQPDRLYLDPGNRYYKLIDAAADGAGLTTLLHLRRHTVRRYEDRCPTLTANMGVGGHNVPFLKDGWGIRRLSVTECARLQGFMPGEYEFPDDLLDRDKYQQIGNAVSVPVAREIMRRCRSLMEEFSNDE